MPGGDHCRGQRRHVDVLERWVDVLLGAAHRVGRCVLGAEVVLDALPHGQWLGPVGLHRVSLGARLPEVEDVDPVGLGVIVGDDVRDLLDRVRLMADVSPEAPRSGPAGQAPVAEVQAHAEQAPVRPIADLQLGSSVGVVELRVAERACHVSLLAGSTAGASRAWN